MTINFLSTEQMFLHEDAMRDTIKQTNVRMTNEVENEFFNQLGWLDGKVNSAR